MGRLQFLILVVVGDTWRINQPDLYDSQPTWSANANKHLH